MGRWLKGAPFILARELADSGPESPRPLLLRYGIAVLAVGLTLVLKLLLGPLFDEESPFLLFFGAVVISAWLGGLGPGLLATVLAALTSDYFFLSPTPSLQVSDFGQGLRLASFLLEGSFISLLVEAMHSARRFAEAKTQQSQRDQERLRESEERFRATFDQAAVGIAHVGPDGRWLRVNQKLCDIVGYEREELLGLTFQDITHPDDLEADLGYVHRLLEGETETYSMKKRYIYKEGRLYSLDLLDRLTSTRTF